MEIDRKMVEYVAELSKLRLSEPEKDLMQQDLTKVLQYMDILNSLPTEGVEPLTHVSGVENGRTWLGPAMTGRKFCRMRLPPKPAASKCRRR